MPPANAHPRWPRSDRWPPQSPYRRRWADLQSGKGVGHQAHTGGLGDQFVALRHLGRWPTEVQGVIPKRRRVIAMFIATPPGRRVIRPGTSEPTRMWLAARPITSQRTEPMQRISGLLCHGFAFGAGQRSASHGAANVKFAQRVSIDSTCISATSLSVHATRRHQAYSVSPI